MNDAAEHPDGLMVLALWVEAGDRLRVRTTRTDVASDRSVTVYCSTSDEVLRVVETWLEASVTPM